MSNGNNPQKPEDVVKFTGNSPAEKLTSLLGFTPGKENIATGVLGEAVLEIRREKAEAGKAKAKELVSKLMGLVAERNKYANEVGGKLAKMDKDIGKAWATIERVAKGQPPEDPNDKKEEEDKAA